MNIYQIDREIMECIDETGEVIDFEKLMSLQMEREQKCENIACWIIDLNAEAKAIKEREAELAARRKSAEAKVERLKEYLSEALQGEALNTSRVQVGWRKSSSVVIETGTEIPEEYIRVKTSTEPDKKAIGDALKAGKVIPGCYWVEKQNIQIK